MALTNKEILEIRKALKDSARPLFFFDDDPDGVCAFIQLYKYAGEGKGVIVKVASELHEEFARKVDEYQPDLVVILDVPKVSQDFVDAVSQKIIWLDHHEPTNIKGIKYYNPRLHDDKDNRPTSYWAWQIAKQDLWLAMVGCIGDWFVPDFKDQVLKEYPSLFKKSIKTPDEALFKSNAGLLSRMIYFGLKGGVNDSMSTVKTLIRINHPDEILNKTTSQGRYIYKRYEKQNIEYQELLAAVKISKDKILVHIYPDNKTSFTSELSNELLYKYPKKIIIVGREKNGEVKMSLRSATIEIAPILKKALEDVEGYGGGHTFACGACVKKTDFDRFVENIRKELK